MDYPCKKISRRKMNVERCHKIPISESGIEKNHGMILKDIVNPLKYCFFTYL